MYNFSISYQKRILEVPHMGWISGLQEFFSRNPVCLLSGGAESRILE